MCRVAGYLGPDLALSALVDEPPHGLTRQSYAARELETSVVSADGWGAAWYLDEAGTEPCIYRSTLPIWADSNRAELGRAIRSRCLLAAVRSATDPLGIAASNTQPFKYGPLSFLHNGYLEHFRERLMRPMRQMLSETAYSAVRGTTDSEHLFALIVDAWLEGESLGPARLGQAVMRALSRIFDLLKTHDSGGLLALLVSDGESLVYSRGAHQKASPTLYQRLDQRGAVFVASEPLDEHPDWQALPSQGCWVARAGRVAAC